MRSAKMADWWRTGMNGNGKPHNRLAELLK